MGLKTDIYFAPLQSYTTLPFYESFAKVSGGVNKYFTPFYRADEQGNFEYESFLQFRNAFKLVPQVLTNKGKELVRFAQDMADRGLDEINLNIGCPFPMVVHRHQGCGLLSFAEEIRKMMEEYYRSGISTKLSIKTRLGWEDRCDILTLLQIIGDYPILEMIIHPRLGIQNYGGVPDWDYFAEVKDVVPVSLVGNGDIGSLKDLHNLQKRFPKVKGWMIGRGLLINPALLYNDQADKERFRRDMIKEIHDLFIQRLQHYKYSDEQILNQLKNFWHYPGMFNLADKKFMKKLRRTGKLSDYWEVLKMFEGE